MQEQDLAVVILAAGKGTRMQNPLPKVLIPIFGKPALEYVLDIAEKLLPSRILVVVGYQADQIREKFSKRDIEFVLQEEQLGTGHAAYQTERVLRSFEGNILILCGDMPLIKGETLRQLINRHKKLEAKCTLLTLKAGVSNDFGRIIRDDKGSILKIVEFRDTSEKEKNVDEFNSGVYCFDKNLFFKALSSVGDNNLQKEYYLTDTIEYSVKSGYPVASVQTEDTEEIIGINSSDDLKRVERLIEKKTRP
jgi:UDP-N-acetylglucosamine diphosphorylase/glucosamine-1-phosphate N-acetyltransferase